MGAWQEWLNLGIRWLHLTAGIAWIGSSFYFMWLDSHLKPGPQTREGMAGELWSVHSGGFYRQIKFMVAPSEMPETLHWFKWEAYTTWMSGFFLLCLVYYVGADAYLIDRGIADFLGWTPTSVRVLYVLISICSAAFPGIIAYLVLWFVMPRQLLAPVAAAQPGAQPGTRGSGH